jgi:metal-sulfur cluster biosynthetic enzyme
MTAQQLDENAVRERLREVIDPELGCNIVDLGLIYEIQIDGSKVAVTMTLTSPTCPVQESIALGAQNALLDLEAVEEVEISLVWEPPWSPARLSNRARAQLGIAD